MNYEESRSWRPEIKGWSDDIIIFYEEVTKFLPRNAKCVEVGCFEGRSLLFLAEELARQGKVHAHVTGIDPGLSNDGSYESGYLQRFEENVSHIALKVEVSLIREASPQASARFENESLDMVFIDGCHDYGAVKIDIMAWLRKVKVGGVLAGHDFAPEKPMSGVTKAVRLLVPDARVKMGGSVWYVVKK